VNCPPILVAEELAKALKAHRFSMQFECRAGFGDFPERLEDEYTSQVPLVDIVLPVKPTVDLAGRFYYAHGNEMTIGVRRRLMSGKYLFDGSIPMEIVAPHVNLMYELINWLLPSKDNPQGRRLSNDAGTATFVPQIEIVKLWDPELLQQAKQYCGIFRVTFRFLESGND